MTEKGKGEIFEYLDNEIELHPAVIEEDANAIVNIADRNSYIGQVKEFETVFHNLHDVGFTEEMLKKRINLMFEELAEIADAGGTAVRGHFLNLMRNKCIEFQEIEIDQIRQNITDELDKAEVLDGLCDLQYVLSGSVLKLGIDDIFDEAFRAVHENNMDKKYDTYTDVKRRAKEWEDKNKELPFGHEIEIIPDGKENLQLGQMCKYILKVDKKIIKPKDHKKVNLSKFIKDVI